MHWIYLSFAIVTEVAGTMCMKLSEGFSRWLPSVLIFVFYGISFGFFTLALKRIPVSMAYAIWAGLGTALITLLGALIFREPLGPDRMFFIGLIIAGVVGLRLSIRVV